MGRGRESAKQTKVARELKYRSHPGTRSPERESVTADFFDDGDGPDGEGSAGVREPRHPKPLPDVLGR